MGEAFHWFDGARALPEIHRVLRPAGGLDAVVAPRQLARSGTLGRRVRGAAARGAGAGRAAENRPHTLRWQEAFAGNALFTPLEQREFSHPITVDAEQIVQLVLSWSFVAALPEADRERLGRDLSQIVHNHAGDAPLELPFVTYVYLTRKH